MLLTYYGGIGLLGNGNGNGNGFGNGNGNGNGNANGNGNGLSRPDSAFSGTAAAALITGRDTVVGAWHSPMVAPQQLSFNAPGNVFGWAPWVRAIEFDRIMLAPLDFAADTTGVAELRHTTISAPDVNQTQTVTYTPLFTMHRPDEAFFLAQMSFLDLYAALRPDRTAEILVEMDQLLGGLGQVVDLNQGHLRWTHELVGTYYRTVLVIEMAFKNAMACRRPAAYSPQVQPMIPTPGHSAYPSGHAIESFAFAYLLIRLAGIRTSGQIAQISATDPDISAKTNDFNAMLTETADQLFRQADRISRNRSVAGVHFPVDSDAGSRLGLALGRSLIARAADDPPPAATTFEPVKAMDDFDARDAWVAALPQVYGNESLFSGANPNPLAGEPSHDADQALRDLWDRVADEWQI